MKAKDLTQADVGKWVTLRGKIDVVTSRADGAANVFLEIEGDVDFDGDQAVCAVWHNTILEFTDPPAPVHEVGDVFKNLGTHPAEWTS